MNELEQLVFEEIHADQVPHPMSRLYTVEELMALGEVEAIDAVNARKLEIQTAAEDPFNHGWFFRSWDDVLWELLDLRLANVGIPVEFLVAGSNGAGKSQMVARFFTLAQEQCSVEMPEHQRTFWTFSYDDDKSAEVVESAIRFWQPNDYKTETGRLKKLANQKMAYDKAGGFTNNEFALASGAVCRFKTWAQDIGKLEGPRPTSIWSDEAVPVNVLEACENRLLTAAEWTHQMTTTWKDLQAKKAADPQMWFPKHLIGKLLVAVHFVTYTFRDGMTDTIRYFLGDIESGGITLKPKTLREIEADPEMLPRYDEEGNVIGGERLPSLVHGAKPTRRTMWIYAWQNPLGGNWEGMKRTEKNSTRAKKLWKCYGVAEGTADSPFPNFNESIHVRPLDWLPPYDMGTWWMSCDPNASGGRNWVILWGFVLREAWKSMSAGDIFIAHEYPQTNDVIHVPGLATYTGEECVWASVGGKNGLGLKGQAQKQWGVGYEFRASEIRRVEAWLAKMQGVTQMQDEDQKSMLKVFMRIIDSRASNTAVDGQTESKTILQWMEDNDLFFTQAGNDAGGQKSGGRVLEGEQTLNSTFNWNRELAELDPRTGWREIDPNKGRGPKIRIAAHCTNLIAALQNYPGYSTPGASSSAWKDFIDALRYLMNAEPYHEDPNAEWIIDNGRR